MQILAGCASMNPAAPHVEGLSESDWREERRLLWASLRGSESRNTRMSPWFFPNAQRVIRTPSNADLEAHARLYIREEHYGKVQCNVSGQGSVFECTLADGPFIRFEERCEHANVEFWASRYRVEPWRVDNTNVGYLIFDQDGSPLAALDLDHNWRFRAHLRNPLAENDQIAVESLAHVLAMVWEIDENVWEPICAGSINGRRYPRL